MRRGVLGTGEKENWRELKGLVPRHLNLLRSFRKDVTREEAGDVELKPGDASPQPGSLLFAASSEVNAPFERGSATGHSGLFYSSGGTAEKRPSIHGTLFPRGGVDGTQPHWVAVYGRRVVGTA